MNGNCWPCCCCFGCSCFFGCSCCCLSTTVLVESSATVLAQMLGKNGLEGAETLGSLNVANHADHHHWRSLQDGDSLDGLLLVQLGAQLVHVTHDVGHAGLVRDERSQVHRLGGIVLGKGLALSAVTARALFRQKSERTMSRMFEFTMRHYLFFFFSVKSPCTLR